MNAFLFNVDSTLLEFFTKLSLSHRMYVWLRSSWKGIPNICNLNLKCSISSIQCFIAINSEEKALNSTVCCLLLSHLTGAQFTNIHNERRMTQALRLQRPPIIQCVNNDQNSNITDGNEKQEKNKADDQQQQLDDPLKQNMTGEQQRCFLDLSVIITNTHTTTEDLLNGR